MSEIQRTPDPLDDAAFKAAAELADIGVWVFDVFARRVTMSARAGALYGLPAAVALDEGYWRAGLGVDDRNRATTLLRQAGLDHLEDSLDFALTADDGTQRYLRESWRVTEWSDERAVRVVGAVCDISEQHRGEERRRDLILELQHRLKNILGMVRSLARRTAANSQTVDEFSAHFDGRLVALAQVQTTLARSIDGRVDLEDVVRQELMHSLGSDSLVTVDGPAVRLRGKIAELVALGLHELAANAVKFGALDGSGAVSVTWQLVSEAEDDPQRLVLTWSETGAAAQPVMAHRGFGMALIERGLPYELDATVTTEIGERGLACRIDLPLRPRGAA